MAQTNYTPVDMGWGNPMGSSTGTATAGGPPAGGATAAGGAMPGTTTAGGAFNPYATRQGSPGYRPGMRPGYGGFMPRRGMGMGGDRGFGQRNPWASMGLPPWLGLLGQYFGSMGGYGGKGFNPWGMPQNFGDHSGRPSDTGGGFQTMQGGPEPRPMASPAQSSSNPWSPSNPEGGRNMGGGKPGYQDYQRYLSTAKFQGAPPSYDQWLSQYMVS